MKGLGTGAVFYGFLKRQLGPCFHRGGVDEQSTYIRSWFSTKELGSSSVRRGYRDSSGLSGRPGVNYGKDESREAVMDQSEEGMNVGIWSRNDYGFTIVTRCESPWNLVQCRNYSMLPITDGGRWMRVSGAYAGPLFSSRLRDPFRDGSVRFKSKKKIKKAKQKKREVLSKIKRIRVATKKRKEDMTPEEMLEFRIEKGTRKIQLIKQQVAKFPVQELPPIDEDREVLTPEQLHYLKKIGYKNKNYVPVGRRGVYGGTIQNIHLHWKKHETVQVEIAGFSKEEIKVMADQLARLSGGLVIDIHQTNIVILYRGRNYKQPKELIPIKTLDKRKALMKSKLEQSMKALILNNEKLEKDLKQLRRDNAQWLASKGVQAGNAADAVKGEDGSVKRRRGPTEQEDRQDPDSYASLSDDDSESGLSDPSDLEDYEYEVGAKAEIEGEEGSDPESLGMDSLSDSEDDEDEDESERRIEEYEEDSDPEDLGIPDEKVVVKYHR